MHATNQHDDHVVLHAVGSVERLPLPDLRAAEALAAAMADWDAADLAAYRSSVLDELTLSRGRPPRGFLAVELAALSVVDAAGS